MRQLYPAWYYSSASSCLRAVLSMPLAILAYIFLWFIPHNAVSSAFRVPWYLTVSCLFETFMSVWLHSLFYQSLTYALSFPPCDDYWLRKSFLCNRQISRLPLATLLCSWLRSSGCYITQLPPHVFHVLCYFLTSSKWTLCFLQCYSVPYTSLNMFLGGDQQDRDSATAYSENISNTHTVCQHSKNLILLSITHSCCLKLQTCFSMEHKRRNS